MRYGNRIGDQKRSMDEIVANIKDTVDILEIIKPVYNFKASEV